MSEKKKSLFIKRLFCFHPKWVKGRHDGTFPAKDYAQVSWMDIGYPWTCTRCGKVKYFSDFNPPIQRIE